MAIALVGTPTTTSQAAGSATIVVTYPTGYASGHVAYAFIQGTGAKTINRIEDLGNAQGRRDWHQRLGSLSPAPRRKS